MLIRKRPWWALATSVLSLACLSQAFLFSEIPTGVNGENVAIVSRGLGFYCWVASIACVFYGTIMMLIYRAFKRDIMRAAPSTTETSMANPITAPVMAKTKNKIKSKPKGKGQKKSANTLLTSPPDELIHPPHPPAVPVFHKNALSIPDGPISTPTNP